MPKGHKSGCGCGSCKAARGETKGGNNPWLEMKKG